MSSRGQQEDLHAEKKLKINETEPKTEDMLQKLEDKTVCNCVLKLCESVFPIFRHSMKICVVRESIQ